MRIAIDMQSTIGESTGVGRYAAGLLAGLRQVAPQHEYVEVTLGRPLVWRVANLLKWSQWQLPSRVWRARVDVLHSVNYDVPLLRRCPVVQTIHDVAQLTFTQFHPTRWHWLYWSVWGPLSMHWASHVVTVSEYSKQDIMRHLRIPEARISVVYNGVDARFRVCGQPSQLHDLRRRYHLPPHFILFVGAVRPLKGVDTLIAAFARLAEAWPEVGLAVAGGYLLKPASPRACGFWATCPTTTWCCCTTLPLCWRTLRASRASASPCWRPWLAARRWSAPPQPACPKWLAMLRCWCQPTIPKHWQRQWTGSCATPTFATPCAPRAWPAPRSSPGMNALAKRSPCTKV